MRNSASLAPLLILSFPGPTARNEIVHDRGVRALRRQDGRVRLVDSLYIRKGPRHDH